MAELLNCTFNEISNTDIEPTNSNNNIDWVFYISLLPYIITLGFALPKTHVGSKTFWISNGHRICGILTLTWPLGLMLYQAINLKETNILCYFIGVFVISFNCIFGALLIPKRINKFDIPTIRAFVVGVILGLSFVCLSLNYAFGHYKSFEPFGKILSIGSLLGIYLYLFFVLFV